jgi:hypothetical protein
LGGLSNALIPFVLFARNRSKPSVKEISALLFFKMRREPRPAMAFEWRKEN